MSKISSKVLFVVMCMCGVFTSIAWGGGSEDGDSLQSSPSSGGWESEARDPLRSVASSSRASPPTLSIQEQDFHQNFSFGRVAFLEQAEGSRDVEALLAESEGERVENILKDLRTTSQEVEEQENHYSVPSKGLQSVLFCFDFDETITNKHMCSALYRDPPVFGWQSEESPSDAEAVHTKVRDFLSESGIKNQEKLYETMKNILRTGNKIAITSYSDQLYSIRPTLHAIGLSELEVSQVYFGPLTCHSPYYKFEEPAKRNLGELKEKAGKNYHITQAIRYFGVQTIDEVVLVDDCQENIDLLPEKIIDVKVSGILVPRGTNPDPTYLDQILALLRK